MRMSKWSSCIWREGCECSSHLSRTCDFFGAVLRPMHPQVEWCGLHIVFCRRIFLFAMLCQQILTRIFSETGVKDLFGQFDSPYIIFEKNS